MRRHRVLAALTLTASKSGTSRSGTSTHHMIDLGM